METYLETTTRGRALALLAKIDAAFAPEIAAGRFTTWATEEQVISAGNKWLIPLGVHVDRMDPARRAALLDGESRVTATIERDQNGKPTGIVTTPAR